MDQTAVLTAGRSTRRSWVALSLGMALLAACGGDKQANRVSDSALDRDLTLAAETRPATVPIIVPLGDTAVRTPQATSPSRSPVASLPPRPSSRPAPAPPASPAPRPTAQTPAPAPQAPSTAVPTTAPAPGSTGTAATGKADSAISGTGRGTHSIGAGTRLVATTTSQLCTLANRPGDKIVANLDSRIIGPDGAELPAGTPVLVEMAAAEPPDVFAFRVRGVQVNGKLIPVEGRVVAEGEMTDRRVSKGGDKGKVATGAVIGAILGRVLGGDTKGTVIGAAGGAAAGTVMAARNSTTEHCLPAGSSITVTLSAPLVYPAPAQ